MDFRSVLADAFLITGFVFVMMVVVEYLNILSAGLLGDRLKERGFLSCVGVASLGTVPGCLGTFTGVTLYVHGFVSFGALVGGMIATSGDEAFVMIALFPRQAALLFGILLVYGIVVGRAVDRITGERFYAGAPCDAGLSFHRGERIHGLPFRGGKPRMRDVFTRCSIALGLALFLLAVVMGLIGPPVWNWIRVSLLVVTAVGLWIVCTVSDHFLKDHLYGHVVRDHLLRIFLWVLGILLAMEFVEAANLPLEPLVREHPVWALFVAALVGIIPESGPHLLFVSLFAEGWIPFSILAASSVVQDGHGALPLLAESRKEFLKVKAVNLAAGILLGLGIMAVGY